jgi:hypothetical protein
MSSVKEVSSLVISDVYLEGASRQFHVRNIISKLIYYWRSPKQGIGHNALIRKDCVRKLLWCLGTGRIRLHPPDSHPTLDKPFSPPFHAK